MHCISRRNSSRSSDGFTLVELLVTLAILGLTAAMVPLGLATVTPTAADAASARVDSVRQLAVTSGHPIRIAVEGTGPLGTDSATFYPDGTASCASWVAGGHAWLIDPWTAHPVSRDSP